MHIHVITTGGTLDKIYHDALSEYRIGDPAINHILDEAGVTFEHTVEELLRKDSLELDDADRTLIRSRVEACPHRHILITHGTDTMTHTAEHLLGISGKVVVFTGALQPARFRVNDATFNVGFALGALQALPDGIYVAMSGQIFAAGTVRKNRAAGRFETS
ncbi:MAG: asparaginase domain-containing protein [Acidihalobacter sp.]|uniref:asparaginase domain-containing protein n=1 Tax=Acidihalobacter sp. TaxID=1872108 RepID=UPI00307F6DD4